MRAPLAIATAALMGIALTSITLGVPGDDSARSRIRVLEQRVIAANTAIPAARAAEADAARRLAESLDRLQAASPELRARAATAVTLPLGIMLDQIRALLQAGPVIDAGGIFEFARNSGMIKAAV